MTNQTILTTDDLNLLDNAATSRSITLRRDYSGRAMYGATCIGFIYADLGDLLGAIIDVAADDLALADSLTYVRVDSLGYDTIAYFPRLAAPAGSTDDEDEDSL